VTKGVLVIFRGVVVICMQTKRCDSNFKLVYKLV